MGASGNLKRIAGMKGGERRDAARQEYDAYIRAQQEKQQARAQQQSQPAPQSAPQQRSPGVRMGPGYAERSFG